MLVRRLCSDSSAGCLPSGKQNPSTPVCLFIPVTNEGLLSRDSVVSTVVCWSRLVYRWWRNVKRNAVCWRFECESRLMYREVAVCGGVSGRYQIRQRLEICWFGLRYAGMHLHTLHALCSSQLSAARFLVVLASRFTPYRPVISNSSRMVEAASEMCSRVRSNDRPVIGRAMLVSNSRSTEGRSKP